MAEWESGRRVYNYIITENVKRLLRRNYDMAVTPHVKSGMIDEQRLFATTSILGIDEAYSRRVNVCFKQKFPIQYPNFRDSNQLLKCTVLAHLFIAFQTSKFQ